MHSRKIERRTGNRATLILATWLGLTAQTVPAASQQRVSAAPTAASEFDTLCRADAGRLWGRSLCGPLIVVDPATRAVWANQADGENLLARSAEGGWIGILPPGIGVANTSIEWAGVRWIMVMAPLPDDAVARRVLLAHEAWHRLQGQIGLPARSSECAHLESETGRTLMRLEMRALEHSLRSRGSARWDAARVALRLRAERLKAFPAAHADETALDRNEGLAQYTGVRLGAAAGAQPFAARDLRRYDTHEALARTYAYATGPAYGLLLDERAPGWRSRLADLAPADLLALALNLGPEPDRAALLARAELYGSTEVMRQERERAVRAADRITRARALFAEGPRLVLPLRAMQMEFNPNQVMPVPALGTVYETLTVRDRWGEFRATAGALLSSDFSTLVAARPNGDGLSGPGWTLTLAPGYRVDVTGGSFVLIGPPP